MESAFRGPCPDGLKIIETFRAEAGGFVRLERHLARMAATAARLGIAFDRAGAEAALAEVPGTGAWRVRLTLDRAGRFGMTRAPLGPAPGRWRLAVSGVRLDPGDPWLSVKTTNRGLYDAARAALPAGIDEMLFLNTRGAVCEGTITNLFLETGGGLLTPPLTDGLLPGVLRAELIETGAARETSMTPLDLERAGAIYVGNSLRGLIKAEMA